MRHFIWSPSPALACSPCVWGIPSPAGALGNPSSQGSMQPVLTVQQSGAGLRRGSMTTLKLARFLEWAVGPISLSKQDWHFLSLCVITKGACAPAAVPLPSPGPGGTWHQPAGVTLDKLFNVFQTEFLQL